MRESVTNLFLLKNQTARSRAVALRASIPPSPRKLNSRISPYRSCTPMRESATTLDSPVARLGRSPSSHFLLLQKMLRFSIPSSLAKVSFGELPALLTDFCG